MTTTTYKVPDVSCAHCERAIHASVSAVPGVEQVGVDLDAKTVTVSGGDARAVHAAIVDAGYAVA